MIQTKNIAKSILIILALTFASSANAEGRVNFSFSINVNGQNQGHNQQHGLNNFFNQVFNQGGHHQNTGHYHVGVNGMQYWVNGNHNQHKKTYKHQPQKPKYAKLTSKKKLVRHLRKLGYRHVKRIQRNGRYYTARAISPRGHKVWVKIDRRNGRIKGQRVLAWKNRR